VGMFARTTTSAPATLDERIASARATSSSALHVFRVAADDLEQAAEDLDAVRAEAVAEIERLADVEGEAFRQASAARANAGRIRDLVGEAL